MNIFVINSGSSSIKYQLISMPEKTIICSGLVESIGLANSTIIHKTYKDGKEQILKETPDIIDHAAGLQEVARLLTDPAIGVINDPSEIAAVGHRIVHGGENLSATTFISPEVKEEIKRIFPLAPLHNPAHYLGIEVAEKIFTQAKQIAVFDTAFHHTMPEKAFRYAIPGEFYHTHKIRIYGFHGTSHKYVSEQAVQYLGKPSSKIITVHLGNGCSMAAIENGKCVDTSMGLGPLDGLIMGTRSGNIDASVIFHLVSQLGYEIEQVSNLLNKKSGMLGLSGFSDMRDIKKEIDNGNAEAKLAYEMYAYRIRKFIGSYAVVLNGLDAIVFTGGVGENDALTRKMVTANLEWLGIIPDEDKNQLRMNGLHEINAVDSKVKILVVPTNEELEIASQCYQLLN
ncbi:MAG: acetate kinase [Ferruginibacter sp.]|nr:acetate kinase [Ferruginibacter sp.]